MSFLIKFSKIISSMQMHGNDKRSSIIAKYRLSGKTDINSSKIYSVMTDVYDTQNMVGFTRLPLLLLLQHLSVYKMCSLSFKYSYSIYKYLSHYKLLSFEALSMLWISYLESTHLKNKMNNSRREGNILASFFKDDLGMNIR